MIGGALRLAGMAGRALVSPGVGGQVARGLAGTGAIMAAPSVYDATFGTGSKRAIDQIISDQPVLAPGEKYEIDLGNRLRSALNQLTGGKGITQDSIKDRKQNLDLSTIQQNPELVARLNEIGVTPTKGDTVAGLTAKHRKDIKRLENKERVADAIGEAAALAEYSRSTPEYIREQARIEEDRAYRRSQDKLARQDSIDARQDTLDFNMANLAFKEAESKRQFDIQSKRAHKEKMAAIIAGLGGLAGAFAI